MNWFDKLFKNKKPKKVSKQQTTTAKQQATKDKKPYVAVLDVHMDETNPRNGFFELDWNEYFVRELRLNGYQGTSEEEIVDAWFKELCGSIAQDEGIADNQYQMGAGYVNVTPLENNRSEIG